MKLLLAIMTLCFLAPFVVSAQTVVPLTAQNPNQIVIINGKKFFPLQNARRYHGVPVQPVMVKPLNNPAKQYNVAPNNKLPLTVSKDASINQIPTASPPATSAAASPAATTLPNTQTNTSSATPSAPLPHSPAADILSLFSPEDSVTPTSSIKK